MDEIQIPETATYLGDGVYAVVDGDAAELYTEREDCVHMIVLDAPTIRRLAAMTGGAK